MTHAGDDQNARSDGRSEQRAEDDRHHDPRFHVAAVKVDAGAGRGGDIAQGSGTFILRNSILAASSAGTNAYDTSASRITDSGYNLSSDTSLGLSGTSLSNTDPLLSPTLANNGGPTMTLAFSSSASPAINKIPSGLGPTTDQRGIPRPQPQGGLSDIGAYELVTRPAILAQPQSQSVTAGQSASFTVTASGSM